MVHQNHEINLLSIYKEQLLKIITQYIPECKIILFGSRAAGTSQEGSDIDIALDTGSAIPFDTILKIYVALDESTIPVKVDIVDMHTADDRIKKEILKKGVVWKN